MATLLLSNAISYEKLVIKHSGTKASVNVNARGYKSSFSSKLLSRSSKSQGQRFICDHEKSWWNM